MSQAVTVDDNLKSAPEGAFAFESTCQFAQPSARDSSSKLRRAKVSMLARTGQPVYHWYWGWIVHDMAGMKAPEKISLDYRHDGDRIIGYADKITAKNDLTIEGELLSRNEDDIAAEVMDYGAAGVPYQCSIQFNPYSVLLEYVPDQAKTKVNGLEVTGPCVIVREWELQRCAVTPTGVDGGTSTKFSTESAQRAAQFSLRWKDSPAMTKSTSAPAATTAEAGQQSQPANAPATGASAATSTATAAAGQQSQPGVSTETVVSASTFEAEFRNKLKRYTDRFGAEHGAKYFADALSYEGALEQHCTKLQADLQASFAANEELTKKLAALDLGEKTPVNTGNQSGKDEKTAKFEDNFKSRDAKK